MNTEDLVSKEREGEIYRERNQARLDAGGAGPLSHYDFGVGFRAALVEVGVGLVMETTSRKDWPACPIRDGEQDECEAFHAMFRLKDAGVPTTCPVQEGGSFVVSPQCPFYTLGAVLVRAKDAPPKGA